ncbi:MAG: hypothetical protein WCF36_18230 [Candidatus Nanopelagicales bacterium]
MSLRAQRRFDGAHTIESTFEPEPVRQLKESSDSDLSIGGTGIAAEAIRHGLVDE